MSQFNEFNHQRAIRDELVLLGWSDVYFSNTPDISINGKSFTFGLDGSIVQWIGEYCTHEKEIGIAVGDSPKCIAANAHELVAKFAINS